MTHKLKNGTEYTVREMTPDDGELMLPYLEKIAAESDNLTFGPGEFTPTAEEERDFLRSIRESGNCLAAAAFLNGEVIGMLSFHGGGRKRIAHQGEFGVSVLKEFWGNGIASVLIGMLLDWAEISPVTKINLKARADNRVALGLYEKLGFRREGVLTRDFLIDGVYYDSVLMGKVIEKDSPSMG